MNIVDITEFYSERGGGVRSHLTIRGHVLCQLGHPHTVIAPGPRDEERVLCTKDGAREQSPIQARVVRVAGPQLPYDPTYHVFGRFGTVQRIVRDSRADVLEAHSPYLGAAAVLSCGRAASRIRTAFWHADHVGTYVEPVLQRTLGETASRVLTRPLWAGVRTLLAPFDATFVAGVAQAARLRAAGVRNVVRAPFGVDVDMFHPRPQDPILRRELADGQPGDIVIAAGRLAVEKRWDVVLDAFARLRERRQATLVVFGDGPERARLERHAPRGVRFIGFETDRLKLARALASADVLVHGCPYETFGLGVVEAIASGLPIVAPDRGGAAENVDPSCSATYASLDAVACAAALEQMLGRDRAALRALAVDAASRVTTVGQHFRAVLSAYDDLLAA